MVMINSTFGENGPPFAGYKIGTGFGKVCRSYINDPTVRTNGKHAPNGDGYYRENRFWRGKWETDQQWGMGFGERPDYAKMRAKSGSVAPNAYGDVSKKLNAAYKSIIYTDIKIKARFPSIAQKIAANPRYAGPGPQKYDTRIPAGQGGLSKGSGNPKWEMGKRIPDNKKLNEEEGKPGPGHYNTSGIPGKNYPIKHGTLYDITLGTRFASQDSRKQQGPGPGQYRVPSMFDPQ